MTDASPKRELGEAETRTLALVARHATDLVLLTDAEGRIEWANEAFQRATVVFELDADGCWTSLTQAWHVLTGHEAQASIGRPLVEFLHLDDRRTAQDLLTALLERRTDEGRQELRVITARGAACWTAMHARPVIEEGVCLGLAGTLTDVTARRHVEQELERARIAAETASVAKSEFLKSMSHEMRTPLNGVLGLMELLAATPLDPQQARYVDVARASATHLSRLIADMLELSRIDVGAVALERTLFDLPDLIESSFDVVSAKASARRLRLSCTVTQDVPAWVIGDPGRLRQVLVTLLANAVKFTERGGVHVHADAQVDLHSRMATVRIEVHDTGIGMAPDVVERLFLPFTRGDASGTGLGLTICKRLVDAMHGSIAARSVERAGATLTVILPIEVADAAMVEHQALARSSFAPVDGQTSPEWPRPLRVLVAEDHAINQLVVRDMLVAMGLEVDLVADGEQAVAAVRAASYDVVLMDCQMPVLDGLQATRRIRRAQAEGRTSHAPWIIALTANATTEDRQACIEAGMDAYLTKPVRGTVLQRTLQRLAAGEAARPQDGEASAPHVPAVVSMADPPAGSVRGEAPDAVDILDPEEVLLRCNHNGDLGARMLQLFAESLPGELESLDRAAAANDPEALARIAHKLRGAAATLAAARLAGAIAGVELFLTNGDGGPLHDLLGDLRHESALFLGVVPQTVRRLTDGTPKGEGSKQVDGGSTRGR